MTDFNKEISVLREVEKARNAVKRKYNDIKLHKLNADNVINETFKPVVKPLEKLINLTEKNEDYFKEYKTPVKQEKTEKSEDANSGNESSENDGSYDEDLKGDEHDTFASAESGTDDESNFDETIMADTDKENEYLELLFNNKTEMLDTVYGIRKMKDGTLKIGNSVVNIQNDYVIFMRQ